MHRCPRTATSHAAATSAKSIQTPDGEAQRDDEHYSYVAAWDWRGPDNPPELYKEPLEFDYVHPSQTELQVMRQDLVKSR